MHSERLLLLGHDEGLSVLDLFPQEWSEAGGIDVKSPDEAHTMLIWEGEGWVFLFMFRTLLIFLSQSISDECARARRES